MLHVFYYKSLLACRLASLPTKVIVQTFPMLLIE